MNSASSPTRILLCALLALLPGCINLSPNQTPVRTYTFTGAEAGPQGPRALREGDTAFTVVLRSIELPAYLTGSKLVQRVSPHEVTASPWHRWAVDSSEGIHEALSQQLARRLPQAALVRIAPADKTTPSVVLKARILRFEGLAEGQALLSASWTITVAESGWEGRQEEARFTLDWDGQWPTLPERLSAALELWAEALAEDLAWVESARL